MKQTVQPESQSISPQRRFLRRVVLIIAATIVLPILVTTCLLMRTPSWYRPPIIAAEGRQAVRNNLVAAEQAFTESVRGSDGPFTYHLYDADVNRWISMRREIYPLIDQLAPPMLDDPFVLFDEDTIFVAGRYQVMGTRVVVGLKIDVRFESGEIILKAKSISCGSMPMPMSLAENEFSRRIDHAPDKVWPGSPAMSGDLLTGLHISDDAWWKNGGIDYRVMGVRVTPGELSLDIRPMGRHIPTRRSSHSSDSDED